MGQNIKKRDDATGKRNNHSIQTRAGGLEFQEDVTLDPNGSDIPDNNARATLYHPSGSHIALAAGANLYVAVGDSSESVGGDKSVSVKGRQQVVIGGDDRKYVRGNEVVIVGKQIDEQMEAAQKLQRGVEEIETTKINKIKSTKGTMITCPTCQEEYLKKNKSGTALFSLIRKSKIPYFGFAIDVLEWLYKTLIGNTLRVVTGKQLMPTTGNCKNKGCKDGMIESPQNKLEEGNKAAIQKAESMFDELDKYAAKLKGGSAAHLYSGDLTIRAGLVDNTAPSHVDTETYHSDEYVHTKDEVDGSNFVKTGEGNAKRIVNTSPHPTVGNITITAANKLLLQSGSPGFDIVTKGHSSMNFGSFTMSAGEGEAVFCSNNKTIIKGKNVKIDADDRSGAGGILLKSNHTRMAGALHVDGNTTMIGSLSLDGNLCAPFLITESMRLQSDEAGSTKAVANGASWVGSAQALTFADTFLQSIQKYLMPGYVMTIQGLFTIALEIYNLSDISTVLEPIPTGVYLGFCSNAAGPGASWGLIWNFKHCHPMAPQSHTHDYTAPKGQYLNSKEAWGNARTDGSHVPTPATAEGDGTSPGPKSSGGCGGGGFGFGSPNSNATQNRIVRNGNYGIVGGDAYGPYDFVNVIPTSLSGFNLTGFNTGDFYYDPNTGAIQPESKVNFTVGITCEDDITSQIVTPTSPTIDEEKC